VEGEYKMKKAILTIVSLGLIYIFSSSFFINIVPPTKEELLGDYKSEYDNQKYTLSIAANGESKFTVKKDNLLIYEDSCQSLEIEEVDYRTFSTYNLSFDKCDKMDSSAILERDIFFNLIIGNNGSELKRIDPDANVFYKK
jgi:hypothetical protein